MPSIENRVTELERLVAQLQSKSEDGNDWKRTVGMSRGDPVMDEVIDDALDARAAERKALRDEPDTDGR